MQQYYGDVTTSVRYTVEMPLIQLRDRVKGIDGNECEVFNLIKLEERFPSSSYVFLTTDNILMLEYEDEPPPEDIEQTYQTMIDDLLKETNPDD